jgi:hypothetical protein
MSNIGSYEQRLKDFDWSISEKELGYKKGDNINIGWYCTDRICQMGNGDKLALIHQDHLGMSGISPTMISGSCRTRSRRFS